jgi:hypothetical protein
MSIRKLKFVRVFTFPVGRMVRHQSPSNTWWFENGCSSSGVARRLCL